MYINGFKGLRQYFDSTVSLLFSFLNFYEFSIIFELFMLCINSETYVTLQ